MNTRLFVLLLSIMTIGCEKISPFISDVLWNNRIDVDRDGIPRPKDCDDRDPKIGIRLWYHDFDHDGFGAGEKIEACDQPADTTINNVDCDDVHTSAHPEGTEICDDLDNDCNGLTDDGAVDQKTWSEDHDKDTYGSMIKTKVACKAPIDFILDHTDCDDNDKNVHPNAIEKCNKIDDNCNEQTDEGVKTLFYHDSDHDGYGWSPSQYAACTPLSEDVTNATDCDDTHTNAHPGGTEICDLLDNDCNGQTDEPSAVDAITWHADVDQDGYGSKTVLKKACGAQSGFIQNDGDCNDLDKLVHPNAKEICNTIDDNCNEQTDEGVLLTLFADKDGDGYGDLSQEVTGCTASNGDVTNSEDCNDEKKNVHPNAVELCDNQIDENCDGITDNAIEATIFYLDADKDGFGTSAVWIYACVTPTGTVANKSDCDDTNPLVNPNATELCTDQIDNNCNGITDIDAKIVTWYLDKDKDGFGDVTQSKQDCTQPVGYVENATDCSDANASIHPGAQEICNNGTDDNCDESVNQCKWIDKTLTDADTVFWGKSSYDMMGKSLDALSDLNGDGLDEIIVGAPFNSESAFRAGAAYIFLSPISPGNSTAKNADITFLGESTEDHTGSTVTNIGDINNDGFNDVLIATPNHDLLTFKDNGLVSIFFGPITKGIHSIADADVQIYGSGNNHLAGASVTRTGDLNSDGLSDLAIGATHANGNAGAVYILFAPLMKGIHNLANADVTLLGENANDLAASALSSLGDINNDGHADILIGAYAGGSSQNGKAYVSFGPLTKGAHELKKTNILFTGSSANDELGWDVGLIPDVNGDQISDVLISAIGSKGQSGAVYLYFGPLLEGTYSPKQANTVFTGDATGDAGGFKITAIGDINNDGKNDLAISANTHTNTKSKDGSVYIFYGPISPGSFSLSKANVILSGANQGDVIGDALAHGYFNNDTVSDLLIGAAYQNTSGALKISGAASVLFGKGL